MGAANTLAALRSIRAARPDGAPIYVILDNLSAHKGEQIRRWAKRNPGELCFTPTYASCANPIEAHFGPLRQFTVANSDHRNHTAQTQALHATWSRASRKCLQGETALLVVDVEELPDEDGLVGPWCSTEGLGGSCCGKRRT